MKILLLSLALCTVVIPSLASLQSGPPQCPPCPCAGESSSQLADEFVAGNDGSQSGSQGESGSNNMAGQGPQFRQEAQGNDGQGGQAAGGQGSSGNVNPNPPDAIAFSGTRNSPQYFFQTGPVIFDNVITNIGGGYDSRYGVFTAFESGIYLVKYNVVSLRNSTKNADVGLLRNKEFVNAAFGSGSSGETSNTAVLYLNRHDMLSVQGHAESAIFCGEDGDALCSFNVVLLKLGVFADSDTPRPIPGW